MSTPLRKLYAVKKARGIDEDTFRAILQGQTGKDSAKGISWDGANACVAEMEKHGGGSNDHADKPKGWRPTAKSPQARKIYKLWGILLRNGKVKAPKPDGYVKRMSGKDRAEWLTPTECNPVIEGLTRWIIRDGLKHELR